MSLSSTINPLCPPQTGPGSQQGKQQQGGKVTRAGVALPAGVCNNPRAQHRRPLLTWPFVTDVSGRVVSPHPCKLKPAAVTALFNKAGGLLMQD